MVERGISRDEVISTLDHPLRESNVLPVTSELLVRPGQHINLRWPRCSSLTGHKWSSLSGHRGNSKAHGAVTPTIFLGCLAAVVLFVPVLLVAIAVRFTSKGPALYWSDRVGRNNVIFKMPKFRSMRVGTSAVATHLLADVRSHQSPIGSFLRKSSFDELPIR